MRFFRMLKKIKWREIFEKKIRGNFGKNLGEKLMKIYNTQELMYIKFRNNFQKNESGWNFSGNWKKLFKIRGFFKNSFWGFFVVNWGKLWIFFKEGKF